MKHIHLLIAALLVACAGQAQVEETQEEKPMNLIQLTESVDGVAKKSAFTLPSGWGFGVFPWTGDPDSITDWRCTDAYADPPDPVHGVVRCNIPKYKHWQYRITSATSDQEEWIVAAVDTVNELAMYGQPVDPPYTRTTSSSARVRFDVVSYTPEYHREKYVKVRISDSYLADSQIGPIRRYGKCHVYINQQHLSDFDEPTGYRRMVTHALAMKGAWQCLGRGTDYYPLTWRCQNHHLPGVSPPATCGESALMNADMDHVEPFAHDDIPRSLAGMRGWGAWGDKVNLEYLWLYFDPN